MEPTAAIIIIGSEVLSGRTQDENIQYLAKRLSELGIRLKEVRIIGDEEPAIISAAQELSAAYAYVFTTGGLGFTHDDRTAVSLAHAFGTRVQEHPEALRLLQEYYGDALNEARRRMALIPMGAILIDNPVSKAPAFQIQNVFALAGIPCVMQVMFEGLVGRITKGKPIQFATVNCQLPEGIIADSLAKIQNSHPAVEIGSYPYFSSGVLGVNLVLRGTDKNLIQKAMVDVVQMVRDLGGTPVVEEEK